HIGRSFDVQNNDLQTALRAVSRTLYKNKVFLEARRASRHEQKGHKRRRLKSLRWRMFFANEACACTFSAVRKKIRMVQAIRRRGA
ncbi:hypothetical protein K488DRAFT_38097, partial [Vararia minispora EC-137]